jgi:hypothetical protein
MKLLMGKDIIGEILKVGEREIGFLFFKILKRNEEMCFS